MVLQGFRALLANDRIIKIEVKRERCRDSSFEICISGDGQEILGVGEENSGIKYG